MFPRAATVNPPWYCSVYTVMWSRLPNVPQTCVQCALGAEAATDMRTVLTTACGEEPLPPSPSPARAAPADGCLTFLYGSETQTFDGVPPAKVQPP
jgi:hypothetical protein